MRNELVEENGRIVARPTGEPELIPAGSCCGASATRVSRSPGVPFDESTRHDPERGRPGPGRRAHVTAAGWIKRGPSGVIGTNKKDATETVAPLLEDAAPAGQLAARLRHKARGAARERGVEHVE